MKLRDLNPHFIRCIDDVGSYEHVADLEHADGIVFRCPQCCFDPKIKYKHHVVCWFELKVPDTVMPGPGRWKPSGTNFDDLSFIAGMNQMTSIQLLGGCGWHGHIRHGDVSLTPLP